MERVFAATRTTRLRLPTNLPLFDSDSDQDECAPPVAQFPSRMLSAQPQDQQGMKAGASPEIAAEDFAAGGAQVRVAVWSALFRHKPILMFCAVLVYFLLW